MNIIEVLQLQNRLIEHKGNLNDLKEFNDALIKELEFEKENPTMFSKEITKLLVAYGFKHEIRSAYSRYVNYQIHCDFSSYGGDLKFSNKSEKDVIINILDFNEAILKKLIDETQHFNLLTT